VPDLDRFALALQAAFRELLQAGRKGTTAPSG
jgi:hypothetical protein